MLKKFTYLLGLVFTLVGAAGFLPNGHEVLGVKAHQITIPHNLLHLSTGLGAIYFAYKKPWLIEKFFTSFGCCYFVVGILGVVLNGNIFNLIIVEPIDNSLHIVIAVLCFVVGFVIPRFFHKNRAN